MEVINVKLVEAALNPGDGFKKYLRIENYNSYKFLSLPDLGQISFYKAHYKKLIDDGKLIVKECMEQPQITYMV